MNILCWNCRGLRTPRAVREVAKLANVHKPQIVFLMETKRQGSEMERVRVLLGYNSCLTVDCVRRGGGLALLWMAEINLEVLSYSTHHIHRMVDGGNKGRAWLFMVFYGEPQTNRRLDTWNLLRRLRGLDSLPWLISGDFNELLIDRDKLGGTLHNNRLMDEFRSVFVVFWSSR
ncbi:hypothetical protein PTKIN_Ptkin08bG0069800 [Pterospermum kingtungense]